MSGRRKAAATETSSATEDRRYRPDVVEVLEELFAGRPDVTRGQMFGHPGFYTGGKMFACAFRDGVGLKLPVARVAELLGTPGFHPFEPGPKMTMKEWVEIRRPTAANYQADRPLFEESIAFVAARAAAAPPRRHRKST